MQTSPTRLRTVREAKGLSLQAVADEVGIDISHLSRIERGLALPSIPTLVRITRVLRLPELERDVDRILGSAVSGAA